MTRALRHALLLAAVLLGPLGPLLAASAHAQDELDELAEDEAASASEEQDTPAEEIEQPAGDEAQEPATDEAEEPASDEAVEPQAGQSSEGRALTLYVGAGLGLGTVSFERPTAAGAQVLDETPFAAAEVLVRVRAWPEQSVSLEALLAYHSSLGLRLQLAPLFALPQSVSARVERGELSVAPVFRLGDRDSAFAVALPIGFAFQSLVSELHQFEMPHYVVGGPQLRAELLVELGEIVQLRAGPEAQWIMLITSSLAEEEACCQGFAFGGQCAIEARVGPHVGVALAYRQLQSLVPAPGTQFVDVERFLTARIAGGF